MTSYQNTIMDLLIGDTPKAKHDYLVELLLDRDKFAMEILKWYLSQDEIELQEDTFYFMDDIDGDFPLTIEVMKKKLERYKQSLTKTDKK